MARIVADADRVGQELRTAATIVSGCVELLVERAPGPLGPDDRRMLDAIERGAERILAAVRELHASG